MASPMNRVLTTNQVSFVSLLTFFKYSGNEKKATIVSQLEMQLIATPEVSGSNPVIGKIYIDHWFTVSCIEKTKIKKNGPGNGQLLKKDIIVNVGYLYSIKLLP